MIAFGSFKISNEIENFWKFLNNYNPIQFKFGDFKNSIMAIDSLNCCWSDWLVTNTYEEGWWFLNIKLIRHSVEGHAKYI